MKARCKADYEYPTIQACAGETFDKVEFRAVPVDREAEARANPYLEIEDGPEPIKAVVERKGRK